ncbi:hypothetical protein N2152v2_005085 [Parachlorella kessleri]
MVKQQEEQLQGEQHEEQQWQQDVSGAQPRQPALAKAKAEQRPLWSLAAWALPGLAAPRRDTEQSVASSPDLQQQAALQSAVLGNGQGPEVPAQGCKTAAATGIQGSRGSTTTSASAWQG